MATLFWLIVLGLIIYLLTRGNSSPPSILSPEQRLAERNVEWSRFIAGYRKVVKSKSEKALIDRMLSDIKSQGLIATTWEMPEEWDNQSQADNVQKQPVSALATPALEYELEPMVEPAPKVELDNISLLLYFGAFLFVASVGLFIAFSGANGMVRTIAVLAVTCVLYFAGIWLFRNKPKLEQAGIAFTGIGMTIAPLVGVAAYYYLFEQTNAPAVWFVTSFLCFGMYLHALWVFRRPLVSYILIFTFLSLFESGVSILSAPVYYFGWAMAFVGITLTIVSRIKGFWPEVQDSSRASSQLILPLAILTSLVLVPGHGAGQLGVSLLFAALYYGLEAINTKDSEQQNNAITAHIASLLSLACLSYAAGHSWNTVAVSVLIANLVQMLCMLLIPQKGALWQNFASVLLGASMAGIVLAIASPGLLLVSTGTMVAIGLVVWHSQRRVEGYVLGVLAWMSLPLLFGQNFVNVRLDATPQALLMFSTLLIQLGVYLWYGSGHKESDWKVIAQQVYVLSSVAVLVAALFTPAWVCLGLSAGVVATMILLAEEERDSDWAAIAGVMVCVPIIRAVEVPGALVASTTIALLLNIILALRYRKELNRWLSTGIWLILPLSLGAGLLGHWTAAAYGWAYLVVMLCLVLSRTIARGGLLVSSKVPLASYAKSASFSYVVGYWSAAVLAIGISLTSPNSRFHTSLIITIITLVVYYLAKWVEKRADLMLALSLLVQFILWSSLRPIAGTESMIIYLLSSTALAVVCYFGWLDHPESSNNSETLIKIREGALASLFISPIAIFVVPQLLWPMPVGLFIAGAVFYYHIRHTNQENRELAGGLIVASILWFLWFAGIRELQVYTHVIVALLGVYAYWRAVRQENAQSDQYLMYMLATATIPLGLQALSGRAGGLYGWWLLLEQIAFMLIGMAIKKRIVTLWGLYVAVGAVLYQLRNLGWAALTVLAVFLIGIAIYQLQRHEKN